jgi:hypothetical protein
VEPILIMSIPVLALAIGLVAVLKMPRKAFGGSSTKADLADRVRALEQDVQGRMDAMEQEIAGLRQELGETQERLDFTERLLTRADAARRLDQPT